MRPLSASRRRVSLAVQSVLLAGLAASAANAQIVDTRVPLNYNFHGMAHQGEAVTGATAGNADIILYRSFSDRGLYWDPADANAIGSVPIVGFTGIGYSLFDSLGYVNSTQPNALSNALDMVHIGQRGGIYRPYDTNVTTTNGPFPAWAPDTVTNFDHTGDLTTVLSSPVTVDAATEIGVLYQGSDSGGQFDVVLTFNNGGSETNVTVRVACPDWFGAPADAAVVAGQPISSQRKVSRVSGANTFTTYRGVANNDSAALQAFSTTNAGPNLNVTEAVISVPAIIAGGTNVAGQQLTRITFRNASYPTRTISSLSGNGSVASMTTSTAHGYGVGTTIVVSGASVAGLNGTYTVASVPTTTTLTYANSTVAASTTGTRTVMGLGVHRGYGVFAATVRSGSPANSSCLTAQPISTGTIVTSNSHALTSPPSGFGINDTSAVWYSYTAPSSTLVDVRTCGSGLDTTLVVYDGCGGPTVASNDNGCGTASRVQWQATAGHTYFIRAAGNSGATGTFNLSLEDPAHVDIVMPIQFNWNGICHGVSEQTLPNGGGTVGQTNENRSNLNGFRAIADRGLLCDGIQSDALNFGGTIGYQGMVYSVYSTPLQSDMVHLGNRDLAAGGIRAFSPPGTTWPAQGGTATTQNGLSPLWLNNPDQTGPQTSSMTGLNAVFGPNTKMGLLYHMSNVDTVSGTTPRPAFFDVMLGFTDGSFATVAVQATDWFGTNTQVLPGPATGSGLEAQRVLGIYHAVQNTDIAADAPTGRLKVMEAVLSTAELQNTGFDPVGRTLASVTFGNLRSGNAAQDSIYSAVGIYAATLRDPASFNLNFGPTGTGTVTPNLLNLGATGKMTVNVSRGSGSPNNITNVVVDGTSIGQGIYVLNDSGLSGDTSPNDNVWSRNISFPAGTTPGAVALPFTVTDGQARTSSGTIIFTIVDPSAPPSGTGSGNPNPVVEGQATLLAVTVTPGVFPPSMSINVSVDASGIGASSALELLDNGTGGDLVAGDNIFSATVVANVAAGNFTLPFIVSDDQARATGGTIALTVSASASGGCCGTDNSCVITREFLCLGSGGTFQGAGSSCGGGNYIVTSGGGDFEDISGTGTVISATPGDDAVFNVALSFPFTFFGATYNDVNVSTNGNLQFPPSNSTAFTNIAIPNPALPNNMLAVLWDDFNFNVNASDSLTQETRGTPGVDYRQIFQWTAVSQFGLTAETDFNTFQCVLFEDGHVEYRYAAIAADFSVNADANGATIGVEDPTGGDGSAQFALGATPVASNSSVTLIPGIAPNPCNLCRADFNGDGALDPDDLADYIGAFFSSPPLDGSDFNGDGLTDPDDLADYIGAFFNGCP